jgi:hypothetical protein
VEAATRHPATRESCGPRAGDQVGRRRRELATALLVDVVDVVDVNDIVNISAAPDVKGPLSWTSLTPKFGVNIILIP